MFVVFLANVFIWKFWDIPAFKTETGMEKAGSVCGLGSPAYFCADTVLDCY